MELEWLWKDLLLRHVATLDATLGGNKPLLFIRSGMTPGVDGFVVFALEDRLNMLWF